MDVKEELHKIIDALSPEEAEEVFDVLKTRREANPFIRLQGLVSSGRTNGAKDHDLYLYGSSE